MQGVKALKILVTGGAGFIGRWVVKRLLADGQEVWALDDLSNGRLANIAEFADGVINDYSALVMSRGTMSATRIAAMVINEAKDQITISWNPSEISGLQLNSDIAFAMFIDANTGEVGITSGVLRSVGSIVIPSVEGLDPLNSPHCYLAFKRANGTVISNNSYNLNV